MIAVCPGCKVRYRIDREKIPPEGLRMRCSRCESIFRVRPPTAGAAAPPPASAPTPEPPAPAPAPEPAAPRAAAEPGRDDPQRRVLIADASAESAKATADAVAEWGLQPIVVDDGVAALLAIERIPPRAAILNVDLPKMQGAQICEVVKRNESLRQVGVILVGAAAERSAAPEDSPGSYGADAYLEGTELPDGLVPILRRLGLPLRDASAATPSPAAPREPEPAPPAPASADDGLEAEREKARRLARIVVSDIVLYNEEKFASAVEAGTVAEALDDVLEEGRALFRDRIDSRVREERDYLLDELNRVARERGKG